MTCLLSIYHHPITVETSGSYLHWEWDVGEGRWNAGNRSILKQSLRQGCGARNLLGGDPSKHHGETGKGKKKVATPIHWSWVPWAALGARTEWAHLKCLNSTSCPSLVEGCWEGLVNYLALPTCPENAFIRGQLLGQGRQRGPFTHDTSQSLRDGSGSWKGVLFRFIKLWWVNGDNTTEQESTSFFCKEYKAVTILVSVDHRVSVTTT